jgi:hypothetical protein
MQVFDINSNQGVLEISIQGPMSSYSYSYMAEFTSSKSILLKLTLNKQIIGFKEETMQVKMNSPYFLSADGFNLIRDTVSTFIYPKQDVPAAIDQGSGVISSVLGMTLGIIILSNVLL